ncbi:helix-turn-helix domain-containing protein [Humisphaera borealis]|uniref:Helix-turn-helix domain-containing protein n=1 Tax=Humisphaera borealis TaxID=2807512 RepID=A0A7M2X0M5_9BACT|nr:helix-turn-helix domain-containing protein [Humisphaera borealis]QOV90661.1 helix-turn-helix domain-containing protein [Humisphaera borealis]
MSNQNHTIRPIEKLLSSREAAAFLGVSARTLWTLADQRQLPAVRIGRLVRFDPADLRDFIDRAKGVKTPSAA